MHGCGEMMTAGLSELTPSKGPRFGLDSIQLRFMLPRWIGCAGGEGTVILDRNAITHIREIALFDTIRCDHPTVQKRLKAILSQPERKPNIIGTGAKRERAA